MAKETVKIILTESKAINGKLRKPEYTLLEGICAKGITADNINKVIQLGHAKALSVVKDEERISDADKE